MDHVDRLIKTFRARARLSTLSKLDVLLDLERIRDPRIVPFLLRVLRNRQELVEIRIYVLKRLRNGGFAPEVRPTVAHAIVHVVADGTKPDLRLQGALALAEFTDIEGVPATLGGLALDTSEPLDLRYSAFTSLERAGPSDECVSVLRQLSADEALGPSARSLLSAWQLE